MIFTQEILIFKTIMTFLIVLILDFVAFHIAFTSICWLVLCHYKIAGF